MSHGSSPAAWTSITVALIGFTVGGIGLVLSPVSWPLFYVGLVLSVGAAPLALVMTMAGFGSKEEAH